MLQARCLLSRSTASCLAEKAWGPWRAPSQVSSCPHVDFMDFPTLAPQQVGLCYFFTHLVSKTVTPVLRGSLLFRVHSPRRGQCPLSAPSVFPLYPSALACPVRVESSWPSRVSCIFFLTAAQRPEWRKRTKTPGETWELVRLPR